MTNGKTFSLQMWQKILIGLILGIVAGFVVGEHAKLLKPIGDIFITLIRMVVMPVIFVSLVCGVTAMKDLRKMGRVAGKTLLLYGVTMALAGTMSMLLAGAFGIMAYYMVLGGWVLTYIVNLIGGGLDVSQPLGADTTKAFFAEHIHNRPLSVLFYTLLFVLANYWILTKGVIGGIEKAAKFLMPLLFVFLIFMVIRNVTLPGAAEGIRFYLQPDFSKITPQLFVFVLGQVFFALSLGFGVMITLSSYLDKKENLVQTAVITAVVNTLIAVLAGFMIFPSLFSFGVAPDSGPTLVFQSLPIVFSNMWAGTMFAVVFFSLLLIAALTTSLTIYEVLITALQEKTRLPRRTAIVLVLGGIFLLGNVPSVLGDNLWQQVRLFGLSIFDAFDFASGNILFMLTALGSALFVGFVMKDEAREELGSNSRFTGLWFAYVKYFIPFVILLIFVSNLI